VLGGNSKALANAAFRTVVVQKKIVLLIELTCLRQKFTSVPGQRDTPWRAVQYLKAQFRFDFLDGVGQSRLGEKQLFRCPVNGTGICDLNQIINLL
jgi:hypothetical protein